MTTDTQAPDPMICKTCGMEKEWVDCSDCGGEGYVDETDIDPLDGDEFAPCYMCDTLGGWYECLYAEHHKEMVK